MTDDQAVPLPPDAVKAAAAEIQRIQEASTFWQGPKVLAIAALAAAADVLRAQGAATARERIRAPILKLHAPFRIYDECGHDHTEDDLIRESAIEVDVIGYTCEDGFEYEICVACCCGRDSEQTEECLGSHMHGLDLPRCQTVKLLADLLDGTP